MDTDAVNGAMNKMKHLLFRYYGWIALVAFASAIGIAWINGAKTDWKVVLGILSAALSFVYFVQKQKLEELKLFRELFTEFNKRYDLLHDGLNGLLLDKTKNEITDAKDLELLYNYFNLCGEEYLLYNQGYILPEVWTAWRNGMMIYYRDERIRSVWERELKTGSYYGLKLD